MKRRIGSVTIVDIKGALSGPWALKEKERLSETLAAERGRSVIINMRETTGLDTIGMKSLLEAISPEEKIGILSGSSGIMDLVRRFPESRRFRVFHDEEEIAAAFGDAFVRVEGDEDQREFARLGTALPLEFFYEESDEKIDFRAIITNLSEGGLFAEYIDVKTAEKSLERLNPYDMKVIHIKMLLPGRKMINVQGKVVHRRLNGEQLGIGIQFCNLELTERQAIRNFVKQMG